MTETLPGLDVVTDIEIWEDLQPPCQSNDEKWHKGQATPPAEWIAHAVCKHCGPIVYLYCESCMRYVTEHGPVFKCSKCNKKESLRFTHSERL